MSGWGELKRRAREWHKVLLAEAGNRSEASALLDAAEKTTGIGRSPLPAGDPLLMGGDAFIDPDLNHIFYNEDINTELVAFYQMHEYAHSLLHDERPPCLPGDFDAEAFEEDVPLGIARIEAYNPREREEREANIFAREVLLPADSLNTLVLEQGKNAEEIARLIGVPEGMVFHQLSFSLLVNDLLSDQAESSVIADIPPLDDSQKIVAEWTDGPLLVEAGPGTGKTKTLIGRVEFLLDEGVQPTSILALTFSNKAAEEMRERVSLVAPEAVFQIWMGTFHAFGLELLQKYCNLVGLSPNFRIIDPVDAVFLLENSLSSLGLEYYKNLYDPTINFSHILRAISRAKDELVGPDKYLQLAQNMRAKATSENEIEAAEKALEVAGVYKFYQQTIENESLVDFGDLIFRTVRLLDENPEVRAELRKKYAHVLVDEYQDVNRASGVLLGEIVGDGKGLWVVGDTRQSIYRFRGASPENVRLFPTDFPGAQSKPLGVNYRSRPLVVNVFSALAPNMRATSVVPFSPWEPKRDDASGEAILAVGEDFDAEVGFIAKEIERLKKEGVPYRKQAILCRSHTTMARVASKLENCDIPVLYLGDIFEREEIRDLLSLLSLICMSNGIGLVRVGRFPEYDIPLSDILTLFKVARENNKAFPEALSLAQDISAITPKGREGLALLSSHINGFGFAMNAWSVLVHYLFNRSNYLRPHFEDTSLSGQQQRLAIFQFLRFAHGQMGRPKAHNVDPKKAFLNYIRRLEIQGDDKALRQVPDWANGFDAVRILTVHASKGLQFPAVFIPSVAKSSFPARRQHNPCPPPEGLFPDGFEAGSHDEEEECLFFVALSRSEDYLCVSRPASRGGRRCNPPDMLTGISKSFAQTIPSIPISKLSSGEKSQNPSALPTPITLPELFEVKDLDKYITCPRGYLYGPILGLSGKREDTGYLQFHRCVYKMIRWIGEEHSQGRPIDQNEAISKLKEAWKEVGPNDHAYEDLYFDSAESMVVRAVDRFSSGLRQMESPEWEVPLKSGSVKIVPDSLEEVPGEGIQVMRFRTGRPTKKETDKEIYAIYLDAAERTLGGNPKVRVLYLSTGQIDDVDLSSKKRSTRLEKYDNAIASILELSFPPKPNDRSCPPCPYYFICPSAEDA
jgi:ATP-dependent DNA helicase UvrD/PcrA